MWCACGHQVKWRRQWTRQFEVMLQINLGDNILTSVSTSNNMIFKIYSSGWLSVSRLSPFRTHFITVLHQIHRCPHCEWCILQGSYLTEFDSLCFRQTNKPGTYLTIWLMLTVFCSLDFLLTISLVSLSPSTVGTLSLRWQMQENRSKRPSERDGGDSEAPSGG